MPYRICKSIEIENGHMLSKHPEKCRFPHGHTRKVEFILEADTLDSSEMVCDFKAVKDLVQEFLDGYDHALCMNTDDPQYANFKAIYGDRVIGFAKLDPTTEVMAETIYRYLQTALAQRIADSSAKYAVRPNVRIVRVRVWETTSSWAEYRE
jgi:6-pyruvoyltetrahydropterin/6-carboxytetrahydropterin synthase